MINSSVGNIVTKETELKLLDDISGAMNMSKSYL